MPHDAFISHSTKDKIAADAVVAHLERSGIRCWVAPRDIVPGSSWAKSIVDAINQCKVVVVVFSTNANRSDHVRREIERAVFRGVSVVPVRIENVLPQGELEYFLSSSHWMDAITPPMEKHFDELASTLRRMLATVTSALPVKERGERAVADAAAPAPNFKPVAPPASPRRRRLAVAGVAAVIVLAGLAALAIHSMSSKSGGSAANSKPFDGAASAQNAGISTASGTSGQVTPIASGSSVSGTPAATGSDSDAELNAEIAAYQLETQRGSTRAFFEAKGPLRYRAWLREAERGNAMAQLFVGRSLYEGTGVAADRAEAVKWFQKAADQGNAAAILNLGYMYDRGDGGLALDEEMAARLFRASADGGNSTGMNNLGTMYRDGTGRVPVNAPEAVRWFTQAANLGNILAMRNLAALYASGAAGVPKDPDKSQQWYRQAATGGDEVSQGVLAAPPIAEAFQAYVADTATDADRASALERAKSAVRPLDALGLEALLTVLSDDRIATSMEQPAVQDPNDPLRQLRTQVVERAIELFRRTSRVARNDLLQTFANVTSDTVAAWQKAGEDQRVAAFWRDCYSDLQFANRTSGEMDATLRQLRACILSLLATGNRAEALRQMDDVLAMSDRIRADRPWDWYLKDALMGICFDVAASLVELGEQQKSQALLKRAWTIAMTMHGHEELIERYSVLPLKGLAPDGANDADKEFFLSFAPGAKTTGMKRFTIPTDFAGVKYPFYVYVLSGKRGYLELQDQFRWVREYRGGVIPREVEDSFRRLNKIAVENNVDYAELCAYALGTTQPSTEPSAGQ